MKFKKISNIKTLFLLLSNNRRTRFEAELNAMNWLIKWEEIVNEEKTNQYSKRVDHNYLLQLLWG